MSIILILCETKQQQEIIIQNSHIFNLNNIIIEHLDDNHDICNQMHKITNKYNPRVIIPFGEIIDVDAICDTAATLDLVFHITGYGIQMKCNVEKAHSKWVDVLEHLFPRISFAISLQYSYDLILDSVNEYIDSQALSNDMLDNEIFVDWTLGSIYRWCRLYRPDIEVSPGIKYTVSEDDIFNGNKLFKIIDASNLLNSVIHHVNSL